MADDAPKSRANIYQAPGTQTGYIAEDEPPIAAVAPAPPPLTGDERGRDNRGHRAAVTAAGEVIGSGAGAGDPQSGGGTFELGHPNRPNRGADSSQHNSS